MRDINYNDRYFVAKSNSMNGEVGADTLFHYWQQGQVVWATYEGRQVKFGTLIAKVNDEACLDMRYQHVNRDGELMTGICSSVPEVMPDGRLRLHERWQWTSGDESSGESIIEEVER